MFKELGIKSWTLILTLLPGSLLTLALAVNANGIFSYSRLVQSYLSIGLSLTALGLSGLFALCLSRTLSNQVNQLRRGISTLQAGQLDNPVQPLPSGELALLANDFNLLGKSLQTRHDDMQRRLNQSLEDCRQSRQTVEVQRLELDLARQETLAASRIRNEFLANMRHEIRTPLNGILGFTQLLHKTTLNAQQLDHLHTIQRSAENLLGMLNQALDSAGSEADARRLQSQPFNLRELIQDCLSVVAPAAHAKQLELVSMVYHDLPQRLLGDSNQLRQTLISLIGNAIQLTPAGSIVLRTMLEDESSDFAELRISIQLSAAEQPAAHLPLAPANASELVMVKRLVAQMGGELGMDNTSAAGREWWLSISLAKVDDLAERQTPSLGGKRVAIFEPHPLARQSLHHQLAGCGMDVLDYASIDDLMQAVVEQQQTAHPICLAVLGISAAWMTDQQLGTRLHKLQQLDCQCLVLCPTTELQQRSSICAAAHCQLQAKPADSRKLTRAIEELLDTRQTRVSALHPHTLAYAGIRAKVLCVDDNPANLLLVQTLLEGMGAQVTAVDSGYAAVQASAGQDFDLILMDIQMPGMDGRQASMAIRQREQQLQQQAVPIIALTAHVPQQQKRSLLQAGMNDLICKPVSEAQLAQLLQRWLGAPGSDSATTEPALAVTVAVADDDLAILDHREGLRLAGGKAELANDLLGMLLDSLEEEQLAICQAKSRQDSSALAERVHRLLGATRYCGVPQLRAACQHCENLLGHDSRYAAKALDQLDLAISRLLQESRKAHPEKTAY